MGEKNLDNSGKYESLKDYDKRVQNGAISMDVDEISSGAVCVDSD